MGLGTAGERRGAVMRSLEWDVSANGLGWVEVANYSGVNLMFDFIVIFEGSSIVAVIKQELLA